MANESWTHGDILALRDFLSKTPKFIKELHRSIPPITGDTIEARAINGAEHEGAEKMIRVINRMAELAEPASGNPEYIQPSREEL